MDIFQDLCTKYLISTKKINLKFHSSVDVASLVTTAFEDTSIHNLLNSTTKISSGSLFWGLLLGTTFVSKPDKIIEDWIQSNDLDVRDVLAISQGAYYLINPISSLLGFSFGPFGLLPCALTMDFRFKKKE
eukprot:TRINITY_DN3078_c5_g2_i7.p1 TRINITY_DN3078_c5_g2~~TRINITY_DN3078_c5_g2_i7.p1  ORF type:complete len:147 (-),score=31.63 TRINITY_DN3078_c5_g2_i7:498-890(-)